MKSFNEFCDLMIKNKMKLKWQGQAMIRPEMTGSFIQKMKKAGCSMISYGLENGSQTILKLMNN